MPTHNEETQALPAHELEGMTMLAWMKRMFDRSDDPVYSCDLYRDKEAGSCTHVDGPLCDFPDCSMLKEYRERKSATQPKKEES